MNLRTVSAGNGLQWISRGFELFAKNPGMWVLLAALLLVGTIVVAMVPVLGSVACVVLWSVLVVGLLLGCRALDSGQTLELPHLWAGFQSGPHLPQLALVGVAYLIATVVIMGIAVAVVGIPVVRALSTGAPPSVHTLLPLFGSLALGTLIALALLVPVAMAVWFAPALIVFGDLGATAAMRQSFAACLRNMLPFLVYGAIALVLSIIAAIPFGLGYLVLIPVLACSLYAAYKDIFAEAVSEPAAAGNPLLR